MKRLTAILVLAVVGLGVVLYAMGYFKAGPTASSAAVPAATQPPPTVTVATATRAKIEETVMVTGTLVPRAEILVAPEIEGLRIVELAAEEGDRVKQGQLLARLERATLEAQLAQNEAALARTTAAIAQARSTITQAEARLAEASNSLDRAKPLKKSGYLSESVFDQRDASAKTASAQLVAAGDGLTLAQAEKAQVEAQRRELLWRFSKTEVKAPADGLVSRRNAKIGGLAAGAADAMFRIIEKAEIELEAEIPEGDLARLNLQLSALITVAGVPPVRGKVRLISPEVDKTTRLGRVRVFIGDNPALRIGSFGRGTITTVLSEGLTVPATAVLFGEAGATVQVVKDGRVATRRVTTGLSTGELVEIHAGLTEGELVVAKAGTFLRDGDAVRAVPAERTKTSEVR